MGLTIMDLGEVGGRREFIRAVLPSGIPDNPSIWFVDVGCDRLHGKYPGGVSPSYERHITGKLHRRQFDGRWN